MKLLRIMTVVTLLSLVITSLALGETSITIDQIEANERILGYVSGLNQSEYSNYKVVVYVHTDRWYIHPYAGQGEGLSWASLQENGTWSIQTVRRRFRADKVAALLVKRSYQEPNTIENIHGIPDKAMIIKELRGTHDYGKL